MRNTCRLVELQYKDVICITDGRKLGYVYDIEFDADCGDIVNLVVPGRPRFFGLFGRGQEHLVPWRDIKKIGMDSILVDRYM